MDRGYWIVNGVGQERQWEGYCGTCGLALWFKPSAVDAERVYRAKGIGILSLQRNMRI